jgi:hypothetical protein
MDIAYTFPRSARQPPSQPLQAGEAVECGFCQIWSVESTCAREALQHRERLAIHMEAVGWGTLCDCPSATVKNSRNGCELRVQLRVRPGTIAGWPQDAT